jgi:hypothetical protein
MIVEFEIVSMFVCTNVNLQREDVAFGFFFFFGGY